MVSQGLLLWLQAPRVTRAFVRASTFDAIPEKQVHAYIPIPGPHLHSPCSDLLY